MARIALTEYTQELLAAMLAGKEIQRNKANNWFDCEDSDIWYCLLEDDEDYLRIKPKITTVNINGVIFNSPTKDGGYALNIGGRTFQWDTLKDVDTAYKAIIDALEGNTNE